MEELNSNNSNLKKQATNKSVVIKTEVEESLDEIEDSKEEKLDSNLMGKLPKTMKVKVLKELQELNRKSRENDLKTINELAKEVKQLTSLLPRNVIEKFEQTNYDDNTNEQREIIATVHRNERLRSINNNNNKINSIDNDRRENYYSFSQLLISFSLGVVAVLISISFSPTSS